MNDQSLVVRLDYGEVALLLAGDVEQYGEERIPARRVAALKVPHHGSRTSSSWSFLRRVAPRLAIVSVGRRNLQRLPDPEVLERYRALGVRLYRTDRDGAVTMTTDGRRIWVRTFRSGIDELLPGE
jgi:competence protein ComEC